MFQYTEKSWAVVKCEQLRDFVKYGEFRVSLGNDQLFEE
jgi:hypothetical protein